MTVPAAAPDLLRQSSESLAGRIACYELPGLALREVGFEQADRPWVRGGLRLGFEVKRTVATALTPSMRSAMHYLELKTLTVVHAGDQTFPLSQQIQAVAFRDPLKAVKPLH